MVRGERVKGVKGMSAPQSGLPSSEVVLYVPASGAPLPVEQVETYKGSTSTTALSKAAGKVCTKRSRYSGS